MPKRALLGLFARLSSIWICIWIWLWIPSLSLSQSLWVCLTVCAALTNRSLSVCVCVCDDDDESQGWGRRSRTRYLTAQRTKLNWSQVDAQFKSTTQKTQTQPSPTRRTEQPNDRLPSSIVPSPSLRRFVVASSCCFVVASLLCRLVASALIHRLRAERERWSRTHTRTHTACAFTQTQALPNVRRSGDCLSFSYNRRKISYFSS